MASRWSVPKDISEVSLKLPQKYPNIYHKWIENYPNMI